MLRSFILIPDAISWRFALLIGVSRAIAFNFTFRLQSIEKLINVTQSEITIKFQSLVLWMLMNLCEQFLDLDN
ncbi:asl8055 (plasmid) [Nostoc sp. PCC 7120 = FACHB-418]|nr:asl8055 [Nostoc sp. PCC 7120 = FACHB-418]